MKCSECGNKLVKINCDLISYDLTCESCGIILKQKHLEKLFMKSKTNKIIGFVSMIIGFILITSDFRDHYIANPQYNNIDFYFLYLFGIALIIVGALSILGKINLLVRFLISYHIKTNSRLRH